MKIEKQTLNESKEKLPVSFLTDFVSRGWEDIGYLKETIRSIGENFSGTKKVEELLQALLDAYLVCIGQIELHLDAKDYLDIPEEAKALKEDVDIHIGEDGNVTIKDAEGDGEIIVPIAGEKPTEPEEKAAEAEESEIPPAEVEIPAIEEPKDEAPAEETIAADDGQFNTPFEFDAPEAEGAKKFEKPEVADFFVDFDDPVGEPVSEAELYGEGEQPIENEKIDDGIEPEKTVESDE